MADVYTKLKATLAAVPVLLGHVYPTAAPEGAGSPHLVYQLKTRQDILALDAPTGIAIYTFLLHIAATRYSDVLTVTEAVKAALIAWCAGDSAVLDLEWAEPNPEGWAQQWGVQVRAPEITITYNEMEE